MTTTTPRSLENERYDEAIEWAHDHFDGDMELALTEGTRECAHLGELIDTRVLWLRRAATVDLQERRCMICGNTDEAWLTESYIAVHAQPSDNPDPDGLAGYDPDEDIGPIPINACLLCIAELQTGRAAIVSLADCPAYEDVLAVERERNERRE